MIELVISNKLTKTLILNGKNVSVYNIFLTSNFYLQTPNTLMLILFACLYILFGKVITILRKLLDIWLFIFYS